MGISLTKSIKIFRSLLESEKLFLNCSFGNEVIESSLQQSVEQQSILEKSSFTNLSILVLQHLISDEQKSSLKPLQ